MDFTLNRFERPIIHQKIFYYGLILVAVTLPYLLLANSLSIILVLINWLAEGKFGEKFKSIKNNSLFLIFVSFYGLHLWGMLYTSNTNNGLFELQKKFSLFILPVILATSQKLSSQQIKKILGFFVASVVVASFICTSYAIYRNAVDPSPDTNWLYFSYRDLTQIINIQPTYLAIYVCFSIFILLFFMKERFSIFTSFQKISLFMLFFYLIVFLFFISSRTEIAACIIILFCGGIYYYYKKHKPLKGMLLLTLAGAFLSLIMYQVPVMKERFMQLIGGSYHYTWVNQYGDGKRATPDVRILKWQCAWTIIKDNLLVGVGTGDTQDALQLQYKKTHFDIAYEQQFNAHNQFLETWLGLGIVGLCLLLSCIALPLILSLRQKNYLYVSFLMLFVISCLTESTLCRQYGIVFYGFFTSLFSFHTIDKK